MPIGGLLQHWANRQANTVALIAADINDAASKFTRTGVATAAVGAGRLSYPDLEGLRRLVRLASSKNLRASAWSLKDDEVRLPLSTYKDCGVNAAVLALPHSPI